MKTENQNLYPRRSLAGRVLTIVLLVFGVAATQNILQAESTEPAIESVTPESAAEGTVVTIAGANFGPSVGAVQGTSGVSFNGVWATVASWSDEEIQVAVPPGASTGEVLVTVSSQSSAGVEFTVTGTGGSGPAIGTVSPALGMEGTVVTVRGANFGSTGEMGGVSFNGVWAAASSWSDEEILVPVPADATTGSVVVTANGQASDGVTFIVMDTGLGGAVIDSLSAASGSEGTVVTIEGSNFGPSMGAYEGTSGVSFNGVWGQPTYWSDTVIQVPVPAGAPSGLVTVTAGGEASNGMAFTVIRPAPVIEAIDPAFGSEGTEVTVRGWNFGPSIAALQGTSGVSFNGMWGTPASWSDTEIRVEAPAGALSGLVVVIAGGQASNGSPVTVTGAGTVSRSSAAATRDEGTAPAIRKLKPGLGAVGTVVKIKGSHFGASQGESRVTFNGVSAEPVSWSDTKIKAPVPVGAATGPVVVTVNGQASSGVDFTVGGPAPVIRKLKPGLGAVGTVVKIKGSHFGVSQGESRVTFNGVSAAPVSWSDTKIKATVPVGAATGPVVVTVNGQASSGVEFTVGGPAPVIRKLKPGLGAVGTVVKIKGSHFGISQGDSTVTFNGVVAEPTSWSDTKIKAAVPAGATTGPVVVTVNGQASSGVEFTVGGPAPVIRKLKPGLGAVGTVVKIKGAHFGVSQGDSTVTFNGVSAEPVSWSDTKIKAAVPAGASTGPVVVTVNGQASSGIEFTVTATPASD